MTLEPGSDQFVERALADAIERLGDDELGRRLATAREIVSGMSTLRGALASANANMAELFAELEEAKETAETASRAKSTFLATMSHELRTPVHGILGMMDLLANTGLGSDQRRLLETAQRSAKSLVAIVGDVLDLTKLDSNGLDLDEAELDLFAVVDEIVQLHAATATQKGIALSSSFAPGTVRMLRGDAPRIRQVLSHLVSNGVKFTAAGSVRVEASTSVDANGVLVRLTVTDTGIGMTPKVLASVFDPFFQADASMSRRYGGTGLGLAVSRKLCRRMNGDLTVSSELGAGAAFVATMRLGLSRAVPAPQSADPAELEAGGLAGLRVLLVDDDEINATLGRLVLESAGCVVLEASNGREACRAVLREPLDLVLMDLHMPVVNGYEAAREIRHLEACGALDRKTRLPIVAAIGSADEDPAACAASGMDDSVTKPFSQADIAAALARHARR
ncbi:MAG: response regulator [Deltaproteobacteria bacterium]|nr:response regulator [Deltaproteobacteria bacterium]